jgi:predicted lysophospholipase L1 biosynthesis ABC-type transport system permease subunit
LLIRTDGPAAALVPVVRQTLQSLTPDMGYVDVDTLEAMLAPQLQPWRLGSSIFLACGGVALLIAVVGMYSALAFAVSQRRQEIGVRMALGATPWRIMRAIGASSAATTLIGLGSGLAGAALATRWLSDFLYQTSPRTYRRSPPPSTMRSLSPCTTYGDASSTPGSTTRFCTRKP